jgi:hypothetical protein
MKTLVFAFALSLVCFSEFAFSGSADKRTCADSISTKAVSDSGVSSKSAVLLRLAKYFARNGRIPASGNALARLQQIETLHSSTPTSAISRADILSLFGMSEQDWDILRNVNLGVASLPLLGSKNFAEVLRAHGDKKIEATADQIRVLTTLNDRVDAARVEMTTHLLKAEIASIQTSYRLLTQSELEAVVRTAISDPQFKLNDLGYDSIAAWRKNIILPEKAQKAIAAVFVDAIKDHAIEKGEIPESLESIYKVMANRGRITVVDVMALVESGIIKDANSIVNDTEAQYEQIFAKVLDKRIYTQERVEALRTAVRAPDIILISLTENQDIPNQDFESARQLSIAYNNAPIIISAPFGEVGAVPKRMAWLFKEANVHIFTGHDLQLLKDFHIMNTGVLHKTDPLMGLDEMLEPTDRAVVFSSIVKQRTMQTEYFDITSPWRISTGSICDPIYADKYASQVRLSRKAQRIAEQNRGVLVLSRRYRDENIGSIIGAAEKIAPRRALMTEAAFGNPRGLFDLGTVYSPTGAIKIPFLPVIVLGDIHLGITSPLFLKGFLNTLVGLDILRKRQRPPGPGEFNYEAGGMGLGVVVLHDLVDGTPNNHHTIDQLLTKAVEDIRGFSDLSDHFQSAAATLIEMTRLLPNTEFYVPVDNHGSDWLKEKLQSGDLFKGHRPKDVPLILELMLAAINEGADPYQRIFQHFGVNSDRVRFMSNASLGAVAIDVKNPNPKSSLNGIQTGKHGNQGVNGSRSISLKNILISYGAAIAGHTHSTAEDGRAKRVGALLGRQGYQRGPSGADASIALGYSATAIQILRAENGSFIPNVNIADAQTEAKVFPDESFPIFRDFPRSRDHVLTTTLRENPPTKSRKLAK